MKQIKHTNNSLGLNHKLAVKALFRIMDIWELTVANRMNLLGIRSTNRETYNQWKNGFVPNKINRDTEERISHILAIYRNLQILFANNKRADDYIKKPNKFFNGKSPLEVMLGGSIIDLFCVRSYLDSVRG